MNDEATVTKVRETAKPSPAKSGTISATRTRFRALVWTSLVVIVGIGAHSLGRFDPAPPTVNTFADLSGATVSWLLDGEAALDQDRPRLNVRFVVSRTPVSIDARRSEIVLLDGRRRRIPPDAELVLVGADGHVEPLWFYGALPGGFSVRLLSASGTTTSWADWFRDESNLAALGAKKDRMMRFFDGTRSSEPSESTP
jgi:hypothetical protein